MPSLGINLSFRRLGTFPSRTIGGSTRCSDWSDPQSRRVR